MGLYLERSSGPWMACCDICAIAREEVYIERSSAPRDATTHIIMMLVGSALP